MSELLVSERKAARMLGYSERKLWTMRTEGRIPFIRDGRSIRYSVESLRRWIAAQERVTKGGGVKMSQAPP